MSNNIKYAVLHFGYVESYRLGSLVMYFHGEPFDNKQKALKSLANDLLSMYKQDVGFNVQTRACCKKNVGKNFCPDCGNKIKDEEVYAEDFQEWLLELMGRDLDSIGSLDQDESVGWEFGYSAENLIGLDKGEILVLRESAEKNLCVVLGLEE